MAVVPLLMVKAAKSVLISRHLNQSLRFVAAGIRCSSRCPPVLTYTTIRFQPVEFWRRKRVASLATSAWCRANEPPDAIKQQMKEIVKASESEEVITGEKVPADEDADTAAIPRGKKLVYSAEHGFLAYEGRQSTFAKIIKRHGIFVALIGMAASPFMFEKMLEMEWYTGQICAAGTFLFFFVFLQPWGAHVLTRRYPTSIYYNYDTKVFTAELTNFLGFDRKWQFRAEDALHKKTMWTSFRVPATRVSDGKRAKIPVLIDPSSFNDRDAYIYLMRYDEPVNLDLEAKSKEEDAVQREVTILEFDENVKKLNEEFGKKLLAKEDGVGEQRQSPDNELEKADLVDKDKR